MRTRLWSIAGVPGSSRGSSGAAIPNPPAPEAPLHRAGKSLQLPPSSSWPCFLDPDGARRCVPTGSGSRGYVVLQAEGRGWRCVCSPCIWLYLNDRAQPVAMRHEKPVHYISPPRPFPQWRRGRSTHSGRLLPRAIGTPRSVRGDSGIVALAGPVDLHLIAVLARNGRGGKDPGACHTPHLRFRSPHLAASHSRKFAHKQATVAFAQLNSIAAHPPKLPTPLSPPQLHLFALLSNS
jgi:hypothetical protein